MIAEVVLKLPVQAFDYFACFFENSMLVGYRVIVPGIFAVF